MFENIGFPELAIIALVVVVLFGSKKLTELAKGAGKATKEFKRARSEFDKVISGKDDDLTVSKQSKSNKKKEVAV